MEFFDAKVHAKFEEKKEVLATKEDILVLKEDILLLKRELSETKADIIFWTGTVITILGGLFAFLKLFLAK